MGGRGLCAIRRQAIGAREPAPAADRSAVVKDRHAVRSAAGRAARYDSRSVRQNESVKKARGQ